MAAQSEAESVGLCLTCRNVRVMRSDRGSQFYLCRLSVTDSRFAKYPALPVLSCAGYQQTDAKTTS